ncbi:unnamed protein product [Mesocestoides corti]|uniref:Dynein light chain n=2 Tax=Mesocestoides corti TaxID=53468 RepID=A0A0R3U9M5_MESCO|nr:unnamed protein product [Mesocestoides corti]
MRKNGKVRSAGNFAHQKRPHKQEHHKKQHQPAMKIGKKVGTNDDSKRSSLQLLLPKSGTQNDSLQVVVKCFCMSDEMLNYAVVCADEALRQSATRKDVAAYVKRHFDAKYGPLWHCVVGRDFGSYVTHQDLGFAVFHIGEWAFLLFSTRP